LLIILNSLQQKELYYNHSMAMLQTAFQTALDANFTC